MDFRPWTDDDSRWLDQEARRLRVPKVLPPVVSAEDRRKIVGYDVKEPVTQAFNVRRPRRPRQGSQPSLPRRRLPQPVELPDGRWRMRVARKGRRIERTFQTQEEAFRWLAEKLKEQ